MTEHRDPEAGIARPEASDAGTLDDGGLAEGGDRREEMVQAQSPADTPLTSGRFSDLDAPVERDEADSA